MMKCFFLSLFFLFFSVQLFAQNNNNWADGVDDEPIHWGFKFQYISSDYKIIKKPTWRNPYISDGDLITDSLYSISSPSTGGFGIGFVSDVRINNHVNIRLTPGFIFADRKLNYAYADSALFKQKVVQSTVVDFPLGIKLKSDKISNFRAYILGGIRYSLDIVSKKKTDDTELMLLEKMVKNTKHTLSYDIGIGLDFYFEYFKLSPELKYSQSFNSVLKAADQPYSSPIDKLFLHNLQFSLYFE